MNKRSTSGRLSRIGALTKDAVMTLTPSLGVAHRSLFQPTTPSLSTTTLLRMWVAVSVVTIHHSRQLTRAHKGEHEADVKEWNGRLSLERAASFVMRIIGIGDVDSR